MNEYTCIANVEISAWVKGNTREEAEEVFLAWLKEHASYNALVMDEGDVELQEVDHEIRHAELESEEACISEPENEADAHQEER